MFSDPWWIFTCINLLWNIKYRYGFTFVELINVSPRFGILLLSMCLSIGFIIVDILSVTSAIGIGLADGINPFWKFSFIFKCFTDTIILDDFKTVLDKLWQYKVDRMRNNTCTSLNSGQQSQWLRREKTGRESSYRNESLGATPDESLRGIQVEVELRLSTDDGEHNCQSSKLTCDIIGGPRARGV